MALSLAVANLKSRQIRSRISGLTGRGTRRINITNALVPQTQQGGIGGLISRIFNAGGRLLGFLGRIVGRFLSFSATAIFSMLLSGFNFVWNFNWNATDQQLMQQLQAANVGLAATWGGTLGGTLGWTAAIGIGYGLAFVCPVIGGSALARAVAGAALPEAYEEVGNYWRGAFAATGRWIVQQGATRAYIGARRILRNASDQTLIQLFGPQNAAFIRYIWRDGEPNTSFAAQTERIIERLPPAAQAFAEEFADEFWDGFTEAGYLIASEMDSQIQAAKAGVKLIEGNDRRVRLKPDRDSNESFVLEGKEKAVRENLHTQLTNYRTLYNRDVGQIIGQPATDYMRAQPQRRKLLIVFCSVQRPPFRSAKRAEYSIPDPKPNLSWEQIKRAARFYKWGRFRATANLQNGRQMAVYGATAQDAEQKLRELMDLTTSEVSTMSVLEEKDRNPRLRKTPTIMYPHSGSFLVRRPTVDPTVGRTIGDSQLEEQIIRFDLWRDQEPLEYADVRAFLNNVPPS